MEINTGFRILKKDFIRFIEIIHWKKGKNVFLKALRSMK